MTELNKVIKELKEWQADKWQEIPKTTLQKWHKQVGKDIQEGKTTLLHWMIKGELYRLLDYHRATQITAPKKTLRLTKKKKG